MSGGAWAAGVAAMTMGAAAPSPLHPMNDDAARPPPSPPLSQLCPSSKLARLPRHFNQRVANDVRAAVLGGRWDSDCHSWKTRDGCVGVIMSASGGRDPTESAQGLADVDDDAG